MCHGAGGRGRGSRCSSSSASSGGGSGGLTPSLGTDSGCGRGVTWGRHLCCECGRWLWVAQEAKRRSNFEIIVGKQGRHRRVIGNAR